ncbi:hypothetical protein C7B62_25050 [Pleurocapsa sp. CCALA 161]|uniref:hypothetical protein n=1 Tax=Pleurocapsa sp. CCALA 161 TaxID=2107688 RepID=UPI000D06520D|nr:hypothetical protein [Pleurocapsa sp. CCALA 161]PSB05519.1 hypothetical protein C7B62_25050 [Pleurocapsa sp. CCALA 161]
MGSNDTLGCEAGNDALYGGSGNDIFVIGDGQDNIFDFVDGSDQILLTNGLINFFLFYYLISDRQLYFATAIAL